MGGACRPLRRAHNISVRMTWPPPSPRGGRLAPVRNPRTKVQPRGLPMNPTIILAAALTPAATLSVAPAHAASDRPFVSGHGSDANNCSLATPCRSFATAFAATNAGGEIDVLDPAGYGPLTITHAISIVNDGVGTA